MSYTALETEVLLTLKDNFDAENGVDPKDIFRACSSVSDGDISAVLVRTLRLLVEEGLIRKVEKYDGEGVYSVLGFLPTRDGLRAARTL